MTLAYLMNTYPMTSSTFVREEIRAHEAAGIGPVRRYAIRPWDEQLVEPLDIAEREQTDYLLTAGPAALLGNFIVELFRNPVGLAKAIGSSARLIAAARGRAIHNAAYLLEAVRFKQHATQAGTAHVHVHFSTNSAAVAMLARRMGGPEYSFTVHGPDELVEPGRNAFALKARHAQAVIAITEYCRDFIVDHCGEWAADKTHIVGCGIDPDAFALRTEAVTNQQLVCVGRLCEAKQQVLLPELARRLAPDFPELEILLVGDGEDRVEIEASIAKLGVEKNVHLAGWGTKQQVRAALNGARAMLLPSLAEGLPVVIMEAMALGCPVISTRIAGIPELLDETCGWIVPLDDLDALEEATRACLRASPEQLSALGQEGRRRVLERHDQARNAARLRDVILPQPDETA
ncbi:glycosyltransferase family 4 protein [Aliiruegeria lutimaris]|uniref:Glycosyltransferase involved in cell wall bisynthesis n=1 Tax=Aliiruegeria lutimaris TaxID=571298 RepID=A0A1G9FX21_9RHOB|nr:glycosyltransferase family 4 protein [Aliiruegeria lutimaris]SDK92929.1 Glycosyltransferase involved in cell wall bisynthesis [Aliiruegeria lutimaris]